MNPRFVIGTSTNGSPYEASERSQRERFFGYRGHEIEGGDDENQRTFARDLSLLDIDQRESALVDRREELADAAAELRRQSRTYWKRPMARVALGGAGAALSFAAANPIPAALAGAAALLAWGPRDRLGGAFSYLFEIQRSIGS
jgi:hypothetical protein